MRKMGTDTSGDGSRSPTFGRGKLRLDGGKHVTRLRNPAYYIRRTTDGCPLQTRLPEGVTMPVFSRSGEAL